MSSEVAVEMQGGKWKQYPAYKDSGVEWIGEVPEHWIVNKFKRLAFYQEGPGLRNWQFTDDGVRVICVTNITENGIDFSNYSKFISNEEYSQLYKHFTVKKGDLLLSSSGNSWGKVAEFLSDEVVILNTSTIRINENGSQILDRNFLKLALQADNIREQLHLFMTGSCQPNFGPSHLSKTIVPVPPNDEQRAIATFLDFKTGHIDTLIEKKERQVELLQEKRAALISHAVTKGLDTNFKMKDSGVEWLGEVPESWTVNKFKRLAFYQEGPGLRNWQFKDDGVRVICVTNITEGGIDFSNYSKFISNEEYSQLYKHFTVKKGDLLLSSSGNSWGKVAEFSSEEIAILNTSTIRINENSSQILDRKFLKWVLQADNIREQLHLFMTGSCQPNFGPSHLSKIIVPVPEPPEQRTIAAFLDRETRRIDTLTTKIQESISKLREYRTALISAAVTGKIDVRNKET